MRQTIATGTTDKQTGQEVVRLGRKVMTHDGGYLEDFSKRLGGLTLMAREYDRACAMNEPLNEASGRRAIRTAVQELWLRFESGAPLEEIKAEAVKIGAAALRFIVDICPLTDSSATCNEQPATTHQGVPL